MLQPSVYLLVTETPEVVFDGEQAESVVARNSIAPQRGPGGGVVSSLRKVMSGRHEVDIGVLDGGSGRGQGECQGCHKGDEGGGEGESHFESWRWSKVGGGEVERVRARAEGKKEERGELKKYED